MKRLIVFLCAVTVALSVAAVTKHFSFSNGYPTTTTRQSTQATGASFGASGTARTGSTKKIEERSLVGTVVRVDSGDVIWVMPTGGRRAKVRLERVEAPALGQTYGVEAKKFLFDLVNDREVTVRYWEKDRSGSIPGTVFLQHEKGLVEVNLTLVKNGCAWSAAPTRTIKGVNETSREKAYAAAQKDAKANSRGLWSTPNPTRPSEWKKNHH